jgi:hypothetical protein
MKYVMGLAISTFMTFSPAFAGQTLVLYCHFLDNGERFTLIEKNGVDTIRWNNGPEYAVNVQYDEKDRSLHITQSGNNGIFEAAIIDDKGVGRTRYNNGKISAGEIACHS